MGDPTSRPGIDGVDVFSRAYDWPSESKGGQCMDCGFLSRRSMESSRPGAEGVTVEDRWSGRLFRMRDGSAAIPWCFVLPTSTVDLYRESQGFGQDARQEASAKGTPDFVQVSLPESDVMGVLTFERECPAWIRYTQFLSPNEHRQERNAVQLEEARRRTERLFIALALWGLALAVLSIGASLYAVEMRQGLAVALDWFRVNTGLGLGALALLIAPALWIYARERGRATRRSVPRRAWHPPQ